MRVPAVSGTAFLFLSRVSGVVIYGETRSMQASLCTRNAVLQFFEWLL